MKLESLSLQNELRKINIKTNNFYIFREHDT
jgi:hypothetical protein